MSNPEIMLYVPFSQKGVRNLIQFERQENQNPEDATWSEGFPPITMIPESSGGLAPKGLDFNGIFYPLSLDAVHRQSGKQIQYDAEHAVNIGGYSKGAIVQSTSLTKSYISTVDNNLTDPDSASSSGWSPYAQTPVATSTTTGTVKLVDSLASNATDAALTANQGRILASMLASGLTQQVIGSNILKFGRTKGLLPGNNNIQFDTPFTNNCFVGYAVNTTDGNDNAYTVVAYPPTKTGFNCSVRKQAGDTTNQLTDVTWLAIGN